MSMLDATLAKIDEVLSEKAPAKVYCADCDNVCSSTRELDPWRWRCIKAPQPPGYGFVHPTFSPFPPFMICSRKNRDGDCPDFEPRREAPDDMTR